MMSEMSESNPFGGKNKHGMYVPMSDDEMEVLARLAEAKEFKLVIKDWGHVTGFSWERFNEGTWTGLPIVTFGDKRISFYWMMNFEAPVVPQPNWFFDVEVWAMGRLMFRKRLPTELNGKPINIVAGQTMALALDVAIDTISVEFIKEVKPKMIGLTSRHGNMHLDLAHQRLLKQTQDGERLVRSVTEQEAIIATAKMKKVTR
jgi:hypothetical protein